MFLPWRTAFALKSGGMFHRLAYGGDGLAIGFPARITGFKLSRPLRRNELGLSLRQNQALMFQALALKHRFSCAEDI